MTNHPNRSKRLTEEEKGFLRKCLHMGMDEMAESDDGDKNQKLYDSVKQKLGL
jgi:hypothetical protein